MSEVCIVYRCKVCHWETLNAAQSHSCAQELKHKQNAEIAKMHLIVGHVLYELKGRLK